MEWHAGRAPFAVVTLLLCLFQCSNVQGQPNELREHHARANVDSSFHNFVTRPDIRAPKWNVEIHDPNAVAPGYWFVAPYGKADEASIGPHIYDGDGELVWSGVSLLNGSKVFDFRVQSVDGKDMLTFVHAHKEAGMIFDEHYEVSDNVHIGDGAEGTLNIHDFNVVDGGKKAVYVKRSPGKASQEEAMAVGYSGGECNVIYDGFEEVDLEKSDGKSLFSWNSKGHVGLGESALTDASDCRKGWDYFHANAIDKFPDGDYLLSGRFANTLYKISASDGSIVWRIGGDSSDFAFDSQPPFSAQGHARVHSQNETHTTISLLDNAILGSSTTNGQSRGILLSLRTDQKPMTAELTQIYVHPHNEHAVNQGNFQLLQNGNAFLGWRDNALQSEYSPSGDLIMEASLQAPLYSYRNFKYPWTGNPKGDPDVVAKSVDVGGGIVNTTVWVSWNGATEVVGWNLYRTTKKHVKGGKRLLEQNVPKTGFETSMTVHGFFKYVTVEGLDKDGKVLGNSGPVGSEVADSADFEEDDDAGMGLGGVGVQAVTGHPLATFVGGFIIGSICFWLLRACWRREKPWWRPQRSRYGRLLKEDENSFALDDIDDSDDDKGG